VSEQPAAAEDLEQPSRPGDFSKVAGRTPWQLFRRRFRRDRVALGGLTFLVLLVLLAVFAPIVADHVVHHGPNDLDRSTLSDIGLPSVGPGKLYWGGVDTSGRDVFVRTIYGARTSLTVALIATGIATGLGILLGLIAGYVGGWVDTLISRMIDLFLSLPVLLFSIGIAATCSITAEGCLGGLVQPGISLVVLIISLFTWPYIGRIVRGQVLSLREKEFVEAARSLGNPTRGILFREILPNLAAPVIVYATLTIPSNVLFEASLSYLGVGIPPETPSWGRMIAEASRGQLFTVAWWMLVFPGVALVLTTLAFNLVGDGFRDALDPRTQG
jgi:ABC-type dipeptide/oligopeptide/nickel transport system permease subunit